MDLKQTIRSIEDFPEKGIIFRDITTLLQNPEALSVSINKLSSLLSEFDFKYIVSPESRGFIFGMPVAYKMGKGFVPVRKAGKLPYNTISKTYDLEYGRATLEMHTDVLSKGDQVVVVDDLLATGGTSAAVADLVESAGGVIVAHAFLIELTSLNGRKMIEQKDINAKICSVIQY